MTSQPFNTADAILDALSQVDATTVRWELKKLRGIREWALKNLGVNYAVGDRVVLTRSLGRRGTGWYQYREALAKGAVATVTEIDFSPSVVAGLGQWTVTVRLDREWSVHDWTGMPGKGEARRYWNGPAGETPEGMTPPSSFDQERDPDGRRHTFMLGTADVTKAPVTDAPGPIDATGLLVLAEDLERGGLDAYAARLRAVVAAAEEAKA